MSSRVNLDRPQVFLENPIELLTTTETETPDDNIIKNFDGEFIVVIPVYIPRCRLPSPGPGASIES